MQKNFWDINRYLRSIANNLEITCDEIIYMSKTVSRNSNDVKAKFKMGSYILHTIFISNHIVINSCYYFLLFHQSKQKYILPYE